MCVGHPCGCHERSPRPTYLRTHLPTYLQTYIPYPTYLPTDYGPDLLTVDPPTDRPTYVHTYLPTCLPTYLPTCLPAYLPTYFRCLYEPPYSAGGAVCPLWYIEKRYLTWTQMTPKDTSTNKFK